MKSAATESAAKKSDQKEVVARPQSLFAFLSPQNKAKHEAEVVAYIKARQTEVQETKILECYKIEPGNFWKKYEILCRKWIGTSIGDNRGARFAGEILRSVASDPIIVAAIVDNLAVFKVEEEQMMKSNTRPNIQDVWIELSCITGAKSIFDYVQKKYDLNVANLNEATQYAISSGNRELALEVANLSIKQGKKDLGGIYMYMFGNYSLAQEIKAVVDKQSVSPKV